MPFKGIFTTDEIYFRELRHKKTKIANHWFKSNLYLSPISNGSVKKQLARSFS